MHAEQKKTRAWMRANAVDAFATCSFTQAGFMRITTTHSVTGERYGFSDARALLEDFTKWPGHAFWPTPISYFEATEPFKSRLHGPKQITDAYLLGIAKHHGGKVATLDKAMKSLAGPQFADLVEVIE